MRIFLSIVWHFPFFGFVQALSFLLIGLFQCLTIIFIPAGIGTIQIGLYLFNPFNKVMVNRDDLVYIRPDATPTSGFMKGFNLLNRILYFIPGCCIVLSVIFPTICFFISIICIPCGLALAGAIPALFNPINKVCISRDEADRIMQVKFNKESNTETEKATFTIVSLLDEVKSLLWPAIQRYPSFFLYTFIMIGSLLFGYLTCVELYPNYQDKAVFLYTIITQVIVAISFIALVFRSAREYALGILMFALINLVPLIYDIITHDDITHVAVPIISMFTSIALVVCAHENKNNFIKIAALGIIALSLFTFSYDIFLSQVLIKSLINFNSMELIVISNFIILIVIKFSYIATFALLTIGLYKDDCQRGAIQKV